VTFRSVMLVLICLAAGEAAAQYQGRVSVNAVVVPVTVRNNAGRAVTGVARGRFHLRVDGFDVPIRDLDLESDLPISLGYLLPRVLETLKPWSTTALYDAVLRVPEMLEKARHHRRAAILLTDGVDNASEITADEATEVAQRLDTPVYVLGVEPPTAADGTDGPSYEEVLTVIANASGGHYRRIPQAEQMPGVVDDMLHELSSRYILTFTTSGVGQRKWRSIEVTVDGYTAVTRSGYMGTLP